MNDYAFGNFLYALRSEKGLSQAQLGKMLGVTNKAVSKWENGSAKPNTALIPKIADIFGVTVEELFACKRIEKNSEYDHIKNYLLLQKRKYAILCSAFLAALITLPLFLIEFICVMMGFEIPDDVAGPLGAVGFIFAFVISITAYSIYRKNFKQALAPTENVYTPQFVKVIKYGMLFSAVLWWFLIAVLLTVYSLILSFSSDFTNSSIFLSIAVFVLILLFGVFVCFANIKRLLKITFSQNIEKGNTRIRFSELPIWAKICYVATIVLFPIVLNINILGFANKNWLPIKLAVTLLFFGCEFAVIFYHLRKKKIG